MATVEAATQAAQRRFYAGNPQILLMPTEASPGPLREVGKSDVPVVTDWVIKDIVARRTVTMVAGEGGVGKSLLAMQWAASAVERGLRVVYVDSENGKDVIQQRLAMWTAAPRVFEARGMDLESAIDDLGAVVATGCDLLMLDSWVSMWTGSDKSDAAVKRVLEVLRTFAQRHDVAIVLLHHTVKGEEVYRGSGVIKGCVEGLFTFTKGTIADQRTLTCHKLRYAAEPPPATMVVSPTGVFRGIVTPTKESTAKARAEAKPPSVREVIKLRELGLISKRRSRQMLGEPTRWWRLGK